MTNAADSFGRGRGHSRARTPIIIATILAVIALLLSGSAFAFAKTYEGKALPGTTVLGQDVSGKSAAEISAMLTERAKNVTVTVVADGTEHTASLADLGVSVDTEGTAAAAVQRDGGAGQLLSSAFSGDRSVDPIVTVDEKAIGEFATTLIPEGREAAKNAGLVFDEEKQSWSLTEGVPGQGVDPQQLIDTVTAQAQKLESFSVEQPLTDVEPSITTEEAQSALDEISAMVEPAVSISGPDGAVHEPSSERRAGWMLVEESDDGQSLKVSLDEEAVRGWVAGRAEKDAVEAKDGIEQVDADGKTVKVIAEKKDGLEVTNSDAVADQLITAITGKAPFEAKFETKTIAAKVQKAKAPTAEDETSGQDKKSDEKKSDEQKADEQKATPTGEKWIDVDLTAKTVTAYVGDTPVWGPRLMVDGQPGNETVTGSFEIYLRYDRQDMTNAAYYPEDHPKYYYTPDVPWVQYFYRGYGFHGAPWRSSFGYSGSHGCINMPVHEAKWLYDWASIGTRVEVHS